MDFLILAIQNETVQTTGTDGGGSILSILFNVSLGTWIGFVVTLIGSFGVLQVRKWNRRARLRRALAGEIAHQNISRIVESIGSDGGADIQDDESEEYAVDSSQLPPADSIPTQIYEYNTVNLGILPAEEVSDIVDYYSSLLTQKGIIQSIRSGEEVAYADKKELHQNIPELNRDQSTLLGKLEKEGLIHRMKECIRNICRSSEEDQ